MGLGQSPIEKITKRLFEAQLFTLKTQRFVFFESGIRALLFYLALNGKIRNCLLSLMLFLLNFMLLIDS